MFDFSELLLLMPFLNVDVDADVGVDLYVDCRDRLRWSGDVPSCSAKSDVLANKWQVQGSLGVKSPEHGPWSLCCRESSQGPPLGQR